MMKCIDLKSHRTFQLLFALFVLLDVFLIPTIPVLQALQTTAYALETDEKEDLSSGLFEQCIQNLDTAAYDGRLFQDTNKPPNLREQEKFCQCHAQETIKAISGWSASRLINEDRPSPEYLNILIETASFCRAQSNPAPQ